MAKNVASMGIMTTNTGMHLPQLKSSHYLHMDAVSGTSDELTNFPLILLTSCHIRN